MAKKNKKVSVSQKKIQGKINYQKTKLRKKRKEFEQFLNDNKDKRLKIKSWRTIDGSIKEGKSYKHSRIYSGILNEATKINTVIFKLNIKLNRFKSIKELNTPLKKGERREVLGKVWETREIENAIFNDQNIKTVNGINLKTDKDDVLYLLNKLKTKMNAYQNLVLIYDRSGFSKLFIMTDENLNKIEGEHKTKKKRK